MRMRRAAATSAIGAVLTLFAFAAAPARADETTVAPSGIMGGVARAAGGYVPVHANPDLDFWPAYVESQSDNFRSSVLTGGLYPGFLVDAFAWLFGYQPQERALLGVTEAQYPDEPHAAKAGTGDFGAMCTAGQSATIPLPSAVFGKDAAGAPPEPMMTGCIEMWNQYSQYVPWKVANSSSQADLLSGSGIADFGEFTAPGTLTVKVGAMHSEASTNSAGGTAMISDASTVITDIRIGDLQIKQLRASSNARSDGTVKGSTASRELEVIGATYQGQRAVVDERGVSIVVQDQKQNVPLSDPQKGEPLKSVNDQLARQGIVVRLVNGDAPTRTAGSARASSGGLVIAFARSRPLLSPLVSSDQEAAMEQSCVDTQNAANKRWAELNDSYYKPVTGKDLPDQIYLGPYSNPLYDGRPPLNQVPPDASVDQGLPPILPCVALLFQRTVDSGFLLGVTDAAASFRRLPVSGGFEGGGGGGPYIPDREVSETVCVSGCTTGSGNTPDVGPVGEPAGAKELVNARRMFFEGLGADVAGRVKLVYGMLMLIVFAGLAARAAFRNLIRA